jgi:hypothetical protein
MLHLPPPEIRILIPNLGLRSRMVILKVNHLYPFCSFLTRLRPWTRHFNARVHLILSNRRHEFVFGHEGEIHRIH